MQKVIELENKTNPVEGLEIEAGCNEESCYTQNIDDICKAPDVNDPRKRCQNPVYSKSKNHCSVHYFKLRKLYKNYKNVCKTAYSLDIDKNFVDINEHLDYLRNCYKWLTEAYESRLEHRRLGFVPSFWDKGHDLQFEIIMKKVEKCEDLILSESLRKEFSPTVVKQYPQKKSPLQKSRQIVKEFKEKRKKDKESDMQEVEKYIEENKKYKLQVEKLSGLCSKVLDRYFIGTDFDDSEKVLLKIYIFYICRTLYSCDYITEEGVNKYKPSRCNHCHGCGNYLVEEVKKICNCALKYKTFENFLGMMMVELLKTFYAVMLKSYDIFKPIFDDLVKLYKIYDSYILIKYPCVLDWDKTKNRLVLIINE